MILNNWNDYFFQVTFHYNVTFLLSVGISRLQGLTNTLKVITNHNRTYYYMPTLCCDWSDLGHMTTLQNWYWGASASCNIILQSAIKIDIAFTKVPYLYNIVSKCAQ